MSRSAISTAAAAAALLAACEQAPDYRRIAVGDPAPEYAAPTLDGDTIALADLRGHAVMLNLWATWCAPCRYEMPGLQALHEEFADDGLRVVGVSIDGRGSERAVRRFVEDIGVTFTILHDPDERITRLLRTTGVPETYLIDTEGRVAARWIGLFDVEGEATRELVREALSAGAPRREG